jgi:quercetin dioxygenase-like cupin family protein
MSIQKRSHLPKTARQRRRLFQGAIMNFRILSSETDNAISVIDAIFMAGSEPQRHVHTFEDEVFTLHAGSMQFYIGGKSITANAGDVIYAPKGIAHHFEVISPLCRVTLTMTPGNFDQYYWQFSEPFDGIKIPPVQGAPPEDLLSDTILLLENYGVRFV